MRHRVLPVLEAELGPGVAAALARSAEQLREDADALDTLAVDLLAAARREEEPLDGRGVALDVATLSAAAPAIRRRALRAAAIEAGSPAGALSRVQVLAVDALLTHWTGQGPAHLAGGVEASRVSGLLLLAPPTG